MTYRFLFRLRLLRPLRGAAMSTGLGKGKERVFVVGVGMTKFSKVRSMFSAW